MVEGMSGGYEPQHARIFTDKDRQVLAQQWGIDVSQANWGEQLDQQIREAAGMPAATQTEKTTPSLELKLNSGEIIRVGDVVHIVRSDGTQESDWRLVSFGAKSVVVEKNDQTTGQRLRKVVDRGDFINWQLNFSDIGRRSSVSGQPARLIAPEDRRSMAAQFGIDVTQSDWEAQLERQIREATGA